MTKLIFFHSAKIQVTNKFSLILAYELWFLLFFSFRLASLELKTVLSCYIQVVQPWSELVTQW